MRTIKPATGEDVAAVHAAMDLLKRARDMLVGAGASQAADKTRAAIISTQGAQRHVEHRYRRTLATRTPAAHAQ